MRRKVLMSILAIGILCMSGCSAGSDKKPEASSEIVETEGKESPAADDRTNPDTETVFSEAETAPDTEAMTGKIVKVGSDDAKIKVGMVTDVGGINDHSFNQGAWEGLLSISDQLGARVSYIETVGTDEFYDDLCALAEDGNDLCWGVGYQFADAITAAAEAYPEVHFAIVDHEFDDIPPNVTCATFRAEEPSFLVGYIAAAMSKTGVIGFIGGMEVEPLEPFQYGYLAGVDYADRELGKETKVLSKYLGTFTDTEKGKEEAKKLYDSGCDIIFHAAGGAGTGVIEAAEETGNYVIGVDSDQAYLAPDNVLTSAIKNVGVVAANLPIQYSMGEKIGGIEIEYGLSENALGIPKDHPNIPDDIYEETMQLKQKIIQNMISVPGNAEEYARETQEQ